MCRDKGVDVVYLSVDSALGIEAGINAENLTVQVQLIFCFIWVHQILHVLRDVFEYDLIIWVNLLHCILSSSSSLPVSLIYPVLALLLYPNTHLSLMSFEPKKERFSMLHSPIKAKGQQRRFQRPSTVFMHLILNFYLWAFDIHTLAPISGETMHGQLL